MFKTPEIPTDNLYKFISIFGLVIFSLAIYIFVNNQQIFEDSIKQSNIAHTKTLFEKSQNDSKRIILDERIEMLQMKIKSIYGIKNTSTISGEDYNKIKDKVLFENDYEKLKRLELERLLLGDKDFHDKNKLEGVQGNNKLYSTVPIGILLLLGIVLMSLGFTLWYNKTQKYYDKELKHK
jgi:hypothetical protein